MIDERRRGVSKNTASKCANGRKKEGGKGNIDMTEKEGERAREGKNQRNFMSECKRPVLAVAC